MSKLYKSNTPLVTEILERSIYVFNSVKWHFFPNKTFGAKRSPYSKAVEKIHLKKHPLCEICGKRTNQVHRIRPFHLYPDDELEPTNLITLCPSNMIFNDSFSSPSLVCFLFCCFQFIKLFREIAVSFEPFFFVFFSPDNFPCLEHSLFLCRFHLRERTYW